MLLTDHVAVPDFSGGAMENWGLVIYRETALLYDPELSSTENKLMVTLIVAHEIAHTVSTHSFINFFFLSFAHSFVYFSIHLFILIRSFSHSFSCFSFFLSSIYSFFHSFIYLFVYPVCSSFHLFIHSFNDSSVRPFVCFFFS